MSAVASGWRVTPPLVGSDCCFAGLSIGVVLLGNHGAHEDCQRLVGIDFLREDLALPDGFPLAPAPAWFSRRAR